MSPPPQRHVVWMPGRCDWELPPAIDGECLGGGHRVLHELAVAVAATGRSVEVRGEFDFTELRALSEAAGGAAPELPSEPRLPSEHDVILMPEGLREPISFGLIALSPARRILMLMAPPGLFGWPFVGGWSLRAPVHVQLEDVARPEHFRAMAAMGFELWSNSPGLADRITAAGIPGTFVGSGRPLPFPAPGPKRFDVVTLAHNRWSELAAAVADQLDPSVIHHRIPDSSHAEVLRRFGEARVLIHPLRIEGDSRIGQEARAMGAVPVVLNTNPFGVGLSEESGAVPVASLEEMPSAVMRLLRDPQRLAELRARGMRSVPAELNWDQYLDRVETALRIPAPEDPAAQARALIGDGLRVREELLRGDLDWEREKVADLNRVKAEREELVAELERVKARIREMQRTRAWRLAVRVRRTRDRVRRVIR